jgi:ADP-ribose pyrophosphatase YjhB (NUDIX family)
MRLHHLLNRFLKPMTLGVQGVVINASNEVFLVRQTYAGGWHFPGGGVEPGETLRQALARELREEASIELTGPPRLHGVFFNDLYSRRDHIAVFQVKKFRVVSARAPDWEIAAAGYFNLEDLPAQTSREARARLREILEDRVPAELWRCR